MTYLREKQKKERNVFEEVYAISEPGRRTEEKKGRRD